MGWRLLAALVFGAGVVTPAGRAVAAQVPEEPTTTTTTTAPPTTPPPTDPPTTPPPPETTTTGPAPTTTMTAATTTTTTAPVTSTTTPPLTPPAVGGDAPPPPGALPEIPPDLLAKINSVRRSRPNSSVALLDALAPLVAMGMTEQEAVQAGFGRFPVGGRATFTDDWWAPRFVPAIHLHEGTDIFAAYGTPARAPADGVLTHTFGSIGGLAAYVTQPDGTYFYLAHLSRYETGQVPGQQVKAGDVVGYVGDSGNAKGGSPHVHFEIHPHGGGPVNPKPYLDRWLKEAERALPAVVAAAEPVLAERREAAEAAKQELAVVGHTELGGAGGYGDVAVAGRTAVVAAGEPVAAPAVAPDAPCEASIEVVDLTQPTAPAAASSIPVPAGRRIEDLDAVALETPAFTGTLAAAVLGPCAPGAGGTALSLYDVSNPADPRPLADFANPLRLAGAGAGAPACGDVLRGTCPRSTTTVQLRSMGGRLLALTSTAAAGGTPADVFVTDLTQPASPQAVGFLRPGEPGEGAGDGCAPLALDPPAPAPAAANERLATQVGIAGFQLAPDESPVEAPALEAADGFPAVVDAGGRRLGVSAEGAWWSSAWALRVEPPAAGAGDRAGCRGPMDAASSGIDLLAPAGPTAGPLAYVGRGCPARPDSDGTTIPPDPYLADPAGHIVVVDAALDPRQAGLSATGCTPASRLARAAEAGAVGMVLASSFLAGTDEPSAAVDAAAPAIPAVHLPKADGDAVRAILCPPPAPEVAAPCGAPPATVGGSVVELPGQWGGLRLVDVPAGGPPRQVEVFRTRAASASTPAAPGASYAVESVVTDGSQVYVAWGADGLRVLDLASGHPVEVGSFVPAQEPPAPGQEPAPARVIGVSQTADHIVVTDRATGLWVLAKRSPASPPAPAPSPRWLGRWSWQ